MGFLKDSKDNIKEVTLEEALKNGIKAMKNYPNQPYWDNILSYEKYKILLKAKEKNNGI